MIVVVAVCCWGCSFNCNYGRLTERIGRENTRRDGRIPLLVGGTCRREYSQSTATPANRHPCWLVFYATKLSPICFLFFFRILKVLLDCRIKLG